MQLSRNQTQITKKYLDSVNTFCVQLNEFCLMFQGEILRLQTIPASGPNANLAVGFSESLILCPTAEAARNCIRRDLAGARSFLVAADGVLRRLRTQRFEFPMDQPKHQTKFYLLSSGIDEFLQTCRQKALVGIEPICSAA